MGIETREPLRSIAPSELAAQVLAGEHIVKAMGMWLRFDAEANHYREMGRDDLTKLIYAKLDSRPTILPDRNGKEEQGLLRLNRKMSGDVLEAMTAVAYVHGPTEFPFWLDERPGDPDARDLIVVRNGVLNWRTGEMFHDGAFPRLVHVCGSPVEFDPFASEPEAWLAFLDQIFDGDRQQIDLLHEVLGCLLTGQNEMEKIFFMKGPPRSGKGTILKMAEDVIGPGHVTTPKIKQIQDGGFGLKALIGKKAALIGDARCSAKNTEELVETLLSISGRDKQTIKRKWMDDFEGRLGVQFVIVSNELLRLNDGSGAIATRMVVLKTRRSFLGREDRGLYALLSGTQLPGLMNLLLDAARRLRERGRFLTPASSEGEVAALFRQTSTVAAFAHECLVDTAREDDWPTKESVFDDYEAYCDAYSLPCYNKETFWSKLADTGRYSPEMEGRGPRSSGRKRIVRGVTSGWWLLAPPPGDDFDDLEA